MHREAKSAVVLLAMISCVICTDFNICDTCLCQQENYDVQSVNCDCEKSDTKNIETTVANMKNLQHIKTFAVSNCESLSFQANSFKVASDLTSLTITHVGSVALPLGVFSSLALLKIEFVEDLNFGINAFMGAPISEIYIRSSHMNELPQRAFFAMKDVRKFELMNITVNIIQSESIALIANQIQITDSVFNSVAEKAMNFSGVNSIEVTQSSFENMENHIALIAVAKKININNNKFSEIPHGLLSNNGIESNNQISFTNNTVQDFTLKSFDAELNGVAFTNNRFQTNCSSIENVLSYKSTVDDTDQLLNNNYWDSECLSGMFVRLTATVNMSDCNEDAVGRFIVDACRGPMPTLPSPRYKEVVAGRGPRGGKGMQDESTAQNTTTDETDMATFLEQHQDGYHMDSSCKSLRMDVALMWFLFILILASLRR